MAISGSRRSQSAVPSTNHDDLDVIDVCSDSSGDKVPRFVGSPSVDSDATLSEETDAGSAVEGSPSLHKCYSCMFRDMLGLAGLQMPLPHRLCRSSSLIVCLLMACGCMRARGAHITAKLYGSTRDMSAHTQARSRSSAVSARMPPVMLVI
jgi:hypothetical protein